MGLTHGKAGKDMGAMLRGNVYGVFFFAACLNSAAMLGSPCALGEESAPARTAGLAFVFYDDPTITRPNSTGVDAQLNQDTGTEVQGCAKVWMGAVRAPIAGEVTFVAEADDGLRLWIGGKPAIDGWGLSAPREGSYTFASAGDWASLRLEYFQNGGSAHMRLFWAWKGHPIELIPADAFSHTEEDAKRCEEMLATLTNYEEVPLTKDTARTYRAGGNVERQEPLTLKAGPHLFLDDYLIASSENVRREICRPQRDPSIPNPIVTGKGDGCFQPYLTVVRDPETQLYRLWYGVPREDYDTGSSRVAYMESEDGVNWIRPRRILSGMGPIQFGVSVIDEGPEYWNAGQRFKFAWWYEGGLRVATSADGIAWAPLSNNVVLRQNHDITGINWDPLRKRYFATSSVYRQGDQWEGDRRVTMHSFSDDLINWTQPHHVVLPDDSVDKDRKQFYAMDGYLVRGDLMIGMVKVLHDEVKADNPPDPPEAYGIGYTELAWTRDGMTWTRDPQPYFDRHPDKGVWDHAHAWIDEQIPVGDEVYLYYGGYARGHKVNRFEERQIGLLKIKRDRYVAQTAGADAGRITTPAYVLDAAEMTLNVNATNGRVRVQLADDQNKPIPGFTLDDCAPIALDTLDAPVKWQKPLSDLKGKTVRVTFELTNASLFAFNLK